MNTFTKEEIKEELKKIYKEFYKQCFDEDRSDEKIEKRVTHLLDDIKDLKRYLTWHLPVTLNQVCCLLITTAVENFFRERTEKI